MTATHWPTSQPILRDSWLTGLAERLNPTTNRPDTGHWRDFLPRVFPNYFQSFGEHHAAFWEWVWELKRGTQPRPFVAVWPRGHGKSTSAEAAAVAVGARDVRSFVLYVSATQEQADTHVQNIAVMLESPALAREYPEMSQPLLSKFGHSRGWRRNRLRTASGLNVDAIGLDTAARGVKLDEYRPDLIILDDIDNETDTPEATQKKIARITRALLPAGSEDVGVLFIQNLVLSDGIAARLANVAAEPADFLANRIVSGPIPAVEDLVYEDLPDNRARITGGTATWQGMDLAACQDEVDTIGITAFLVECQHDVRERGDKIFLPEWWDGQNRYNFHDPIWRHKAVARFQSWDTAWEETAKAAYSSVVTGDIVPHAGGYALLIRNVWRGKVAFAHLLSSDLQDIVVEQASAWQIDGEWADQSGVVIEYAASGKAVVQQLRVSAPGWLKPKIQRFTPRLSKDERAVQAAHAVRAGRVWLPLPDEAVPWLPAFERELYDLPQSTYRDQSDAFSQLVIFCRNYLQPPALPAANEMTGAQDGTA